MGRINSFEEIEVWKNSRMLVGEIYKITKQLELSRDFGLKDQIQRASVSVMSNIAEGFERKSKKEFIYFLYISRCSAGEVRSLLYLALDLNYIEKLYLKNYQTLPIKYHVNFIG